MHNKEDLAFYHRQCRMALRVTNYLFETDKLNSLNEGIFNLEQLINMIKPYDKNLTEKMHENWSELEINISIAIVEENVSNLSEVNSKTIVDNFQKNLKQLKQILEDYVNKLPDEDDLDEYEE